ncbi:MAG: serine/threonine-protein kinase [Dermatophilaceae bacterium]
MESRPNVPGYHLAELIAAGSTAEVWAAGRTPGGDDLAVKVVPVPGRADLEDLAFELSALASTRGAGEHLVRVVDVVPVPDPPAVAVVMERLRHGTLTDLVGARGHLLPGEVVTLLTPVASALADLHDAAVVHGDLSPSNLGLDAHGRPVVLDLGVSAVIGTPRDEIYGTPGFVAPEVVAGGIPTPAADVYALGALGWFALTAEAPPLPADRPGLTSVVPTVPGALVDALEQALHPDPERRPQARDLSSALYGSATALPIRPGAHGDPAMMLTQRVRDLARAAAREDAESVTRTRAGRRAALRRRSHAARLRVAAALVAMVVLGGVGVAVASAQRGTAPAPTAPGSSAPPLTSAGATAQGGAVDPAERFTAILEALVRARADAWNGADPDLLADCFAPASTALTRDRELLAGALAQGHRYEGVTFAAVAVDTVSESEDRVTLETTLTTGPYAVRTFGGHEARAGSSARVRLVLVRVGAAPGGSVPASGSDPAGPGWRIAGVDAIGA